MPARRRRLPDGSRPPSHQLQLLALLFGRDAIALKSRREAALRTEGQPRQRHEPGRFGYAGLELVIRLQRRFLGRHQAENRDPIFWQVTQWLEPARAGIVVLQQEPVE